MRICYFGTYERLFPRNSVLINGLSSKGVQVVECHSPLSEKKRDKTALSLFGKILMAVQLPFSYVSLALRYQRLKRNEGGFDAVIVGYIGQLDMFLARALVRKGGKALLIFNPMISLYDTLVTDREMVRNPLLTRLLFLLDKKSCERADLVLLDTEEHARYFRKAFGLDNISTLYIGADRIFRPLKQKAGKGKIHILYYGKYTPLQGIEHIIRAAKLLEKHENIHFEIIGTGQTYEAERELADTLGIQNITFTEWVDYKDLPRKIAAADICLGGHFGSSSKAQRVVPNKVFHMIAMAKPVIVSFTKAMQEAGLRGRDNCMFVDVADPDAIARAVSVLAADTTLRAAIARNARLLFVERY